MWGIRGIEDLGGGYKTVFEFQSQFSVNNGAGIPGPGANFDRQAFVGVEKTGLGRISFGKQFNLMADFLFFPPAMLDGAFMYGGLYNMRQGPFAALEIPQNPTGAFDFDQTAGTSRVSNSVKVTSVSFAGLRVGAMYGFGNSPGSLSADNTIGFGVNYTIEGFGAGAAYNETKYVSLNEGHDGIRNFGAGVSQTLGKFYLNALYTNTRNTLTGGVIHATQVGALYSFMPDLRLGGNYQYMKGNATLTNNKAQQVTTTVQYFLSKRTVIYAEAAYQWTGGDVEGSHNAWINGEGPSNTTHQLVGRAGLQTTF
ncbi:porin [Caballeronia humi]|uniref:Outer membrane porin n=1 Tax=Caballeronia humi TaxID=326474 RepID=A0A158JF65_9BURK|nr:porin [Caballeronia humi]SAL67089.1 outer membrane porin [Caballeronia humi]